MKILSGNLLKMAADGDFDVIIHGCNCFCTMGAGIAAQVAEQFPAAYEADKATVRGDIAKIGNYTKAEVNMFGGPVFTIVNAYTQYGYGGRLNGIADVDYYALRNVMHKINTDFSGKRIGYPLIGAGLAGGDWNIIAEIIEQELVDVDHTLVKYIP